MFNMNRLWLWVIVVIFFIISAAHDSYGSSTVKPPESPHEIYFQNAIENSIGTVSNRMVPRYRNMWCVGDLWIVNLNADNHVSTDMIRGMIFMNSRELFGRVFSERKDVKKLSLNWYYPLPLLVGQRKDVPIIKITMSRDRAETVDFGRIPLWEVAGSAERYFEHPAFSNLMSVKNPEI